MKTIVVCFFIGLAAVAVIASPVDKKVQDEKNKPKNDALRSDDIGTIVEKKDVQKQDEPKQDEAKQDVGKKNDEKRDIKILEDETLIKKVRRDIGSFKLEGDQKKEKASVCCG